MSGPLFLAAFSLLLGGCLVGPSFQTPSATLNPEWGGKDGERVTAQAPGCERWWEVFQDPVLDRLVRQAREQNLSLQVAGLRILESRAQLGIAIGQQYPQTQELAGDAATVGISKNAPNTAQADHYVRDYQVGFDAAWELDFWGKFRRNVEAETASLNASMADFANVQISLAAEVARTYAVMRTYEEYVELAQQNVALQEEGLQIAQARFRNGATSELDVMQAQALVESTRASIPQLQIRLKHARNALCTLLGKPVDGVAGLTDGPKVIPTPPAHVAVGVPADLLRRRPDIRAAEQAALAQNARIGMAEADLYPSFSLIGEFGWETSGHSLSHAHNLFDQNSLFYSLGPGVRWPILNYGRIKNNVRVQDARFEQALIQYQETVLRAAQEVDDALTGFVKSQDSAVFDRNTVAASKRSVEIAMTQYREGAVDYQRVLDTQRSLLQSQNSLVQTRSAITTHLIALFKALGGGWELRLAAPPVPAAVREEMRRRTDWGKLLAEPPADGEAPSGQPDNP